MKRWLTLKWTTGPMGRVPHTHGVAGLSGLIVAAGTANSDTEFLCVLKKDNGPLDTLKGKAGVAHHGDETATVEMGRTVYRVGETLRGQLVAEAARLGVNGFRPEGYDVAE